MCQGAKHANGTVEFFCLVHYSSTSRRDVQHAGELLAVAFHKLTHSTGHESRLNRAGVAGSRLAASGSADYSREELVAEMGSAFLCAEAGIESTLDNSAAYLKGWLGALKGDERLIVTAASAAQRAADFILGKNAQESTESKPARKQ